KNGIDYISTIIKEFERLMDEKGYKSTEDMRGIVSRSESEKPELFERLQYIKALVGIE
ncbi:MAG: dihydroorotate dehydrogenase-like protein, partial [Spirochaetes bacterium]